MMDNWRDELCADSGYRIRCMISLMEQIKSEYADLNSFLKIKSGDRNILATDEFLGKISWIKQALKVFDRLKMMDIEGVLSTEVESIKKDIMAISESAERY